MAAPKIIQYVSGRLKQLATIASSAGAGDADKVVATNADGIVDPTLVNATAASAGAGDADKIVQLDASGRIDNTMMPVGIGADTKSITTSEALAAGNIVNVWNSSGSKVRKADATTEGKEGFGFVLSAYGSGVAATVYFEGQITGLSGMTPGARQYLNTTAGGLTETPPSTSGNVVQCVGYALDATTLAFEPQEPITLA